MEREAFLERVRKAAAAGRAYRVHTRPDIPERAGYFGAGSDAALRFAAEVTAVGGVSHQVPDLAAAKSALAAILFRHRPKSALLWSHPLLDRLGVTQLLAERGIDALDHTRLAALDRELRRKIVLDAQIGISSATFAIAETGTLAMSAEPGRERIVSLLPPVHVAIIERSQILPDLFDLFQRLELDGLDRLATSLVLITGPSKTGDLELKLTTGVHGPGQWHVIIVGGAAG